MVKRTHIYHTVSFMEDKFDLLYFWGCNFDCRGCIRHCGHWDHNLSSDCLSRLKTLNPSQVFLSYDEFTKIINNLRNSIVFLGGGEATLDPSLPWIASKLYQSNFYTVLQTNGYSIFPEMWTSISKGIISEIHISLKAISPALHRSLTGYPIHNVLSNLKRLHKLGVRLKVHTTFIPDVISTEEIQKLAIFISDINPNLPLRIDPYVAVPNTSWKTPSTEKLLEVAETAKKYLVNVSYIEGLKSKATLVYP